MILLCCTAVFFVCRTTHPFLQSSSPLSRHPTRNSSTFRGSPGPSGGGPAAPAHRGEAWLSRLLDCWIRLTTFLGMGLFAIRNVMFVNIAPHFQ